MRGSVTARSATTLLAARPRGLAERRQAVLRDLVELPVLRRRVDLRIGRAGVRRRERRRTCRRGGRRPEPLQAARGAPRGRRACSGRPMNDSHASPRRRADGIARLGPARCDRAVVREHGARRADNVAAQPTEGARGEDRGDRGHRRSARVGALAGGRDARAPPAAARRHAERARGARPRDGPQHDAAARVAQPHRPHAHPRRGRRVLRPARGRRRRLAGRARAAQPGTARHAARANQRASIRSYAECRPRRYSRAGSPRRVRCRA